MMKNKMQRKSEALERQAEYSKLTIAQKILKLDLKLGGGKGAKKERARLALLSIKESEGRSIKGKPQEITGTFEKRENHGMGKFHANTGSNTKSKHNHKHNKSKNNVKIKNV